VTEQPGESAFLRRFRESLASFPLTRDDEKSEHISPSRETQKETSNVGFTPFLSFGRFFSKNSSETKKKISRFTSFVVNVRRFLASFWLVFLSTHSWGRKEFYIL
jgi:hypothetical protein